MAKHSLPRAALIALLLGVMAAATGLLTSRGSVLRAQMRVTPLDDEQGHVGLGLALRHLACLLEAVVDELLVDVLDDDGDVGRGDRLRDLTTHRAGADDRGLEDEHSVGTLRGSSGKCRAVT